MEIIIKQSAYGTGGGQLMSNAPTESRRAIEALRAGVPNRDAVRFLGSSQSHIEAKFRQQLEVARQDFLEEKQASGTLIVGNLGSGKSHLLEYLQHIALEENFVCSKVVISKETPLYDAAKVFRAAINNAAVPGRKGAPLAEIAVKLNFDSPAYAELYKWVNRPDTALSTRFAATLYIYEHQKRDLEIQDRIIRFWSGDPVGVVELRGWLRDMGEVATYRIDKVSAKELALQRYKFIPRLMIAAGYSGWVLLIDEVELIRHYSLLQRAKSYAEIARWMGKLEGVSFPGLTAVLAIISEFESRVLDERNDEEKIPGKLRGRGTEPETLLAGQAERGMRVIRRDKELLSTTSEGIIRDTQEKVRSIYTKAYAWEAPTSSAYIDTTATMRQHVKRWITEWDLKRLYSDYQPEIEVGELKQDYSEIPEIETPSEGDVDTSNPDNP